MLTINDFLFNDSHFFIIILDLFVFLWYNDINHVSKGGLMTKREVIKTLILSPLYFGLKLKKRAELIK